MDKKKKVAVIGSGSWGTALANLFADAGQSVTIWGRDKLILEGINQRHQNEKYLKGFPLNSKLRASDELGAVLDENEIVVCSIPTQQIRNVFGPHRSRLKGKH